MSVEFVWVQTENGMTMMSRAPAPDPKGLFGEEGVTFHDVLDMVNPLQNLPIIGNVYREVTGETIKPGSRLIGGILYGFGPGGIMSAALNNAVEEKTGHDIGGALIAMVKGESLERPANLAQTKSDAPTQMAAATTGGADPVDPAWQAYSEARALDAGSVPTNLADASIPSQAPAATPAATRPAVQLGALPTAAAAPAAAQFPSIQAAAQAVAPTVSARGSAGAVPEMPSSAGLTGLSAHSGLPTAASITPAAAALAAAAAQAEAAHTGVAGGGSSALAQSTLAPAAGAQAASDQPATLAAGRPMANAAKFPDGLPAPARINSISPRMPPTLNQQNVGRAPLALSNPVDHRTMDPVTVTPAAAPATSTPPAPIAAVATADAPAAAPVPPAAENAVPNPLAPTLVPEAMARALDKYDALMRARRPGGQLDRNL